MEGPASGGQAEASPAGGSRGAHALAGLTHVRVGTLNAAKLAAVRAALEPYSPQARVEGVEVQSGVPEQPVGWQEIVRGARQRARGALETGGELGIGIEDGLVEIDAGAEGVQRLNVGCCAVVGAGRSGLGFSAGFPYPPACHERAVREREPIGDLFDSFWLERRGDPDRQPSASGIGNIGKLSLGALARSDYSRQAVIAALLGFLHPDLYPDSVERSA